MKYMGSKNRIAKHLLPIMVDAAEKAGITTWVEPFVGGAGMIDKVPDSFERIGYDLNPHTIAALIAIRDMVDELPDSASEAEYKALKGAQPQPITSWIRFVCSFGGKFENGYARSNNNKGFPRNHCMEGFRAAQKQSPKIQGVVFECMSYQDVDVTGALLYCDPPYQGTTGYKTGAFDHKAFFEWCRKMKAKGNIVFVSEYNAPDDFTCVWQGEVKTNFSHGRSGATHKAVEKLFLV